MDGMPNETGSRGREIMDADVGGSPRPHHRATPSDPPPRRSPEISAPPKAAPTSALARPTPDLMAIAYRLIC
jgi:hypothetical protein